MSGSLNVQPGSLRTYSQQHGEVASAVTGVNASTPPTSTVSTTYGNIAHPMSSALNDLLGARGGALESTVSRATQLADGLSNAAGLYEESDQAGASAVNAATGQTGSPSGSQTGSPSAAQSPAAATSSASGASGQMLSQLGQQASQLGQMAQTAGQALSGLGQIPGQVLQGVQGIVESAMGAGGGDPSAMTASATGLVGGEPGGGPNDGTPGDGEPRPGEDREPEDKRDANDRPGDEKPENDDAKPGDDPNPRDAAPAPAPAPTRPADADTSPNPSVLT